MGAPVPSSQAHGELLVVDGLLLAPTTNGLCALDVKTGAVVWRSDSLGAVSVTLSAPTSSRVIVEVDERALHGLDVGSGARVFVARRA